MKTRKQAAKELLGYIERGPSLGHSGDSVSTRMAKEHEADVRRWLRSWVYPVCHQLIPELRIGEQLDDEKEVTSLAR